MLPISICIIGKNEEKNIETCLSSIPKDCFEIIYVDTGSTDSTIQIAQKYTPHIFHFDWADDFGAARNFSISKASNDWVLILDCDESISYIDLNTLPTLLSKNSHSIGLIHLNSITNEIEGANQSFDLLKRLFPKDQFYFVGKIHEQIVPKNKKIKADVFSVPIKVLHTGYSGKKEDLLKKARRNIKLIEKELTKNPNSPYDLFQLGQSYYFIEDYKNAVTYFARAFTYDLDPKLSYVKSMIVSYGYALSNLNYTKDALAICEEVHSYFESYADFMFLCGFLYMKNGPWEKAVEHFKKCTELNDASSDVSTPAYFNLACIYEVLGDKEKALSYFRRVPTFRDSADHIKYLS